MILLVSLLAYLAIGFMMFLKVYFSEYSETDMTFLQSHKYSIFFFLVLFWPVVLLAGYAHLTF